MSSNDQTTQTAGRKGLMITVSVVVIAVAATGIFFMSTSKAVSETVNAGIESIAPAAGDKKKAEKAAEADPAPAGSEMVGDIKIGDPVVARMGKEEIKRSDVFNYITTLPEQIRQMPLQSLFPLALDQVINNKLIGQKADAAKLTNDPEVEKLMDQARDQIVRNVYIERELKMAVSQKDLLKAYEKVLEGFERVDEVRARHILVADEAKAKDIIAKLDGGGDFAELAKESTDAPTAANGGDLGYFAKAEMVPEFAEAAFGLAPGSHSKAPVKTQFGWHVIKVDEKRQRPEPTFEVLKPQLEAQVRREKLNQMVEKWQKEASIKKFDINGDEIKAESKNN